MIVIYGVFYFATIYTTYIYKTLIKKTGNTGNKIMKAILDKGSTVTSCDVGRGVN